MLVLWVDCKKLETVEMQANCFKSGKTLRVNSRKIALYY